MIKSNKVLTLIPIYITKRCSDFNTEWIFYFRWTVIVIVNRDSTVYRDQYEAPICIFTNSVYFSIFSINWSVFSSYFYMRLDFGNEIRNKTIIKAIITTNANDAILNCCLLVLITFLYNHFLFFVCLFVCFLQFKNRIFEEVLVHNTDKGNHY